MNMSSDVEQEFFSRRHHRGPDHRPVQGLRAVRDRAQFLVCLQGPFGQGAGHRTRSWRALRAGRQHPQGRQPRAHHRAADRCDQWRTSLGRALRSRSHRHFRDPGRSGGEDCRRAVGHADQAGGGATAPPWHIQSSRLTSPGCARANGWRAAAANRSSRPRPCMARRSSSIRTSPRRMPASRLPAVSEYASGWTRRSGAGAGRSGTLGAPRDRIGCAGTGQPHGARQCDAVAARSRRRARGMPQHDRAWIRTSRRAMARPAWC